MKLRDFKIDNNEKMTLMGGMNVLESRDLAMEAVSYTHLTLPTNREV